MKHSRTKSQLGFTLIELMVAMVIAVLALGALGYQLSAQFSSSRFQLRMQKTNAALRSLLDIMSQDLKRAGYVASTNQTTIDSFASSANFNLYSLSKSTTTSCVTFAYDRNGNGALDNDERFGFAINNTSKSLMAYQGAAPNCSNVTTAGGWVNISDPTNLQITGLTFKMAPPGTAATAPSETQKGACPFGVEISITGASTYASKNGYTATQTMIIKVRNDASTLLSGSNCTYPA